MGRGVGEAVLAGIEAKKMNLPEHDLAVLTRWSKRP